MSKCRLRSNRIERSSSRLRSHRIETTTLKGSHLDTPAHAGYSMTFVLN